MVFWGNGNIGTAILYIHLFCGSSRFGRKVLLQKPAGRWQALKAYAFVTAGAFTMFVIFMLFVFSRASWHEVLENLHLILNDKNHNVAGMGGVVNLILLPLKQDTIF